MRETAEAKLRAVFLGRGSQFDIKA